MTCSTTRRTAHAQPRRLVRLAQAGLIAMTLAAGASQPAAQPTVKHAAQPAAQPAITASDLLKILKTKLPSTNITEVRETAIPDLFEVWLGDNPAYVSRFNPSLLIFGRLWDVNRMKDVTPPRVLAAQERARSGEGGTARREVVNDGPVYLRDLPLTNSFARGTGRDLVIFSDPGCGYCRKLEGELAQLTGVKVHTFPLAFFGAEGPAAVMCADDRPRAWAAVMNGMTPPAANPACKADGVNANMALARRLGVTATPTLIFPDGTRNEGYMTAAEISQRMAAVSAPAVSAR